MMTLVSRRELLREVLAHPDQVEPRLVFADWLQQHGEVERGELICIDCALEDAEPWSEQQAALEARRTELLRRHGRTWTAPLAGLVEEVRWRRGFVEKVTLSVHQPALPRIFELEPVRVVRWLRSWEWSRFADLGRSAHLDRLAGIELEGFLPDQRALAELLGPGSRVPGLRSLRLTDHRCRDMAALLAAQPWSRLEELDLSFNQLHDDELAALVLAPRLASLRHLHLSDNGAGDRVAEALGRAAHLSAFADLRLDNLRSRRYFPEAGLSARGAAALAVAPRLGQLRRLDLSGHRLGPEGAAELAAASCLGSLRILALAKGEPGVRDAGLRALAASPHLRGLHALFLQANGITDHGAAALLDEGVFPALRRLVLTGNDLSEGLLARLRERYDLGPCERSSGSGPP